ncbi:MAG: cyclic nucleotide-binding protein, partial [Aliarcobacter butzleri]
MSIQDQESFLSNIHPFEVLTPSQMAMCIQHMDIAYYPKDTILISPEKIPEHFFIIIKGSVYEYSNENIVVMDYQHEDSFDSNSLIYGKCDHTFKVNEELICYEIEKKTFLGLIEKNQEFKDFFLKDLVNKIQSLKDKEYTSQLSSFMIAKVGDTLIHEACMVDENTKLIDAIEKSMQFKTSTIIVKKSDGGYGIITDSLLKVKVLLQGRDLTIPVRDIAIFPLLTIQKDDYLFEALTILIKRNIKRIGVTNNNGEMIGILEQIDILSHFANHTYVIESKIKNANKVEDLKIASNEFLNIIKSLQAKGVKIYHISNLIGQLNTKVYQKLYSLVLPEELQKNACLIVMGSEGRNEQIIKTDQDNALVIKNGIDVEQYRPYMQQLTNHLVDLGYPPCEGNIMVSNPYWCKTADEYKTDITKWINSPDMKSYLDLAIFIDAFAVAGDKELLINLKEYLYNKIQSKDIFMAYFAKSTLAFDTPTTFSSFMAKDDLINIKKAAIFPIVQGIRSL